jgi:hypothetical protein
MGKIVLECEERVDGSAKINNITGVMTMEELVAEYGQEAARIYRDNGMCCFLKRNDDGSRTLFISVSNRPLMWLTPGLTVIPQEKVGQVKERLLECQQNLKAAVVVAQSPTRKFTITI